MIITAGIIAGIPSGARIFSINEFGSDQSSRDHVAPWLHDGRCWGSLCLLNGVSIGYPFNIPKRLLAVKFMADNQLIFR